LDKVAIALNEPNTSFAINGERIKATDGARDLLQALYKERFVKSEYSSMVIGTNLAHNFELNVVGFDGASMLGDIPLYRLNNFIGDIKGLSRDQRAVIIARSDAEARELEELLIGDTRISPMLGNKIFLVTIEETTDAYRVVSFTRSISNSLSYGGRTTFPI